MLSAVSTTQDSGGELEPRVDTDGRNADGQDVRVSEVSTADGTAAAGNAEAATVEPGASQDEARRPSGASAKAGARGANRKWFESIHDGKLEFFVSPFQLTRKQRHAMATHLGLPVRKVTVKSGAKPHSHPVTAGLRLAAEAVCRNIINGRRVVDYGGCVLRHVLYSRKNVHCCLSSEPEWDEQISQWLREAGQRALHTCSFENKVTYCTKGLADCPLRSELALFVDTNYYISDDLFLDVVKRSRSVLVVYHDYPVGGGVFYDGEMTVEEESDGSLKVSTLGGSVYRHRRVNLHDRPSSFEHGGVIIRRKEIAKFGLYTVWHYFKANSAKPAKPLVHNPIETPQLGKAESSVVDIRTPGVKCAVTPQELIPEWVQDFTYTEHGLDRTVKHLGPITHVLMTECYGKPRDENLRLTLAQRYKDIARQFNIDATLYRAYQDGCIVAAMFGGLEDDLMTSVAGRRSNSLWFFGWRLARYKKRPGVVDLDMLRLIADNYRSCLFQRRGTLEIAGPLSSAELTVLVTYTATVALVGVIGALGYRRLSRS